LKRLADEVAGNRAATRGVVRAHQAVVFFWFQLCVS
jgi:hypothetical protein